MRLMVISFLLPFLFLLQGQHSDFSETHQYLFHSSASLEVEYLTEAEYNVLQEQLYLSALSLIDDDNDDDEYSPEKKKATFSRTASLFNSIIFVNYYRASLKNTSLPYKYLYTSFPEKFIFQRKIKV